MIAQATKLTSQSESHVLPCPLIEEEFPRPVSLSAGSDIRTPSETGSTPSLSSRISPHEASSLTPTLGTTPSTASYVTTSSDSAHSDLRDLAPPTTLRTDVVMETVAQRHEHQQEGRSYFQNISPELPSKKLLPPKDGSKEGAGAGHSKRKYPLPPLQGGARALWRSFFFANKKKKRGGTSDVHKRAKGDNEENICIRTLVCVCDDDVII